MRLRAWAVPSAALGAILCVWGCNAILGNADGDYVDAGDSMGDGSSDGSSGDAASDGFASDGPVSDGPIPDGGADACAADIAKDPRNCGRCGHDCLQGGCSAGVCEPFVIVGDAAAPEQIVVTATAIYWASNASGTINRVGLDGTGKEELLAPSAAPPNGAIGVDPDGAYYSAEPPDGGNPEVRRCPLSGVCSPEVIGSIAGPAGDVTADGVSAYIASPSTKIFAIRESNLVESVLVSSIISVAQIVAVPPFIYWGDNANQVARVRNDGSDGGFVVNTVGSATFIQVRGNRVAWAGSSGTTSNYGTCDVTNCTATKLNIARNEDVTAVDVDTTNLYWLTRGSGVSNGTLNSCTFADSCLSVKSRATGQPQPVAMTANAQALYWVNNNGGGVGAVMGVAK